jgi:hypothetical protein
MTIKQYIIYVLISFYKHEQMFTMFVCIYIDIYIDIYIYIYIIDTFSLIEGENVRDAENDYNPA